MAKTFGPQRSHYAASYNQLNNEIDKQAVQIAQEVAAGTRTERSGRWDIAALITQSGIVEAVAKSIVSTGSKQEQLDAAEQLHALIQEKIAGPKPALDLGIVALGTSVSGWTRKLAGSQASKSTVRRILWRTHVRTVPLSHDDYRLTTAISDDTAEHANDTTFLALASAYQECAMAKQPYELIHLSSQVLQEAFKVPAPIRGIDFPNYKTLVTRLHSSETSVIDDIEDTLENPAAGYRGLAVLFANTPIDKLSVFIDLPPVVAQRIALSALTPIPRPHARDIAVLRDSLADVIGGKHAAGRLVRAWTDVRTEADASEYGKHDPPQIKPLKVRQNARLAWEEAVNELIEHGVTQLGLTPDMVRDHLDRTLAAITQPAMQNVA
ncbi:MAG: hypothetical protein ACYDEP_02740 [Acidimicrobiales bacterium]